MVYTDTELIDLVRKREKELNRTPKQTEFKQSKTAAIRFGSWNSFLVAADLDLNRDNFKGTNEELISEIKNIYEATGNVPTIKEFEWSRTAMSRYRTWNMFLNAAGLPLSPKKNKVISDADLFAEVRSLAEKIGGIPTSDQFERYNVVLNRFGGWNKFLIAADLLSSENRCQFCGKKVQRKHSKFCTRKCYAKSKQNIKECVVCGKSFVAPPSSYKICCSATCSKKHRQKLQLTGTYDKANAKWIAKRDQYAAEHQGDKHPNAKYWKIKSPTGKTYETVNLKDFIRQNIELFDGSTVRQAFDGIVKIKASEQGKRKRPVKSYKGWTLLDWKD